MECFQPEWKTKQLSKERGKQTVPNAPITERFRHIQMSRSHLNKESKDLKRDDIKIIYKNEKLIKAFFNKSQTRLELPKHVFTYTKLDSHDYRYNYVKRKCTVNHYNIKSIELINNPYVKTLYDLKKVELLRKMNYKEIILYHGTQISKIDSICLNNFNWRLHGTEYGMPRFGQGVYFSPSFYFASLFCDKSYTNDKVVLFCRVLIGNIHEGDSATMVPQHKCDTTVKFDESEVVKFEDDVFYPQYKITFTVKS